MYRHIRFTRPTDLLIARLVDPHDDILRAAFFQFAREKNGAGLSDDEQIARLARMGLGIKCVVVDATSSRNMAILTSSVCRRTSLYKLRRRLGIPSPRRCKHMLDFQGKTQAVLDVKEADVLGKWGPDQVRQRLANMNMFLTR